MSQDSRFSSIVRALKESSEGTEYSSPYKLASGQLRPQNSKVRATVVELLKAEFHLHEFDAETVARAAADLSQLKDAIRNVRFRRYGRLEIQFIEYDVVIWRILPSIENIRFEGDRALQADALRYESLSGTPVLTLRTASKDDLLSGLRDQTSQIWRSNPHAKSIPLRGIEVPGLLSIARLSIGGSPIVGVLDATDGFSRTVGAHRGSGIDVADVLFEYNDEIPDTRLRNDLIALRDSGAADVDSKDAEVAASRLRTSVMPRAQVIVGFRWIDEQPEGNTLRGYDHARRSLVGHIHLEPAMKFTDSTQFALKAKIALEAVLATGEMPRVPGLTDEQVLRTLMFGEQPKGNDHEPLHHDEISLLAVEALRGFSNTERVRVVNRAVSALTGKSPSKTDRGVLAVDTAMRSMLLSTGVGAIDPVYIGKRSTLGRAWTASSLNGARLTRRPISELLHEALTDLQQQHESLAVPSVSAATSELAGLALFDLVEGPGKPLLIRSGSRDEKGEYLPEPPAIMDRLLRTADGLQQLVQVIFDVRAGRRPRRLETGQSASESVLEGNEHLTQADLIELATGKSWHDDLGSGNDPVKILSTSLAQLNDSVSDLNGLVKFVSSILTPDGKPMVDIEGAPFAEQWVTLSDLSFTIRGWAQTFATREEAAKSAQDDDTEDVADWSEKVAI